MFKLPTLLPYPMIQDVSECLEIMGKLCYIISPYDPGISVIIKRQGGEAGITIGDWNGEKPKSKQFTESEIEFLSGCAPKLVDLMSSIGIEQGQFFIAADGTLVDVQMSLNKFIGPGMMRDLFSKTIPTQEVNAVEVVDDNKIQELKPTRPWIIKPSRFRYRERDGIVVPLYARI